MQQITIYISGKITGEPPAACRAKFEAAEYNIRNLGATPINPLKLGIPENATYPEAKPRCFEEIGKAEAMFMLEDYTNSPGATDELDEAQRLGLEIFYENLGGYEQVEDAITLGILASGY